MKLVHFRKAIRGSLSAGRLPSYHEKFPGYLFTHTDHPGVEFVVAKGSVTHYNGRDRVIPFARPVRWHALIRSCGFAIMQVRATESPTREETYNKALAVLSTTTPAELQEFIDDVKAKRAKFFLGCNSLGGTNG